MIIFVLMTCTCLQTYIPNGTVWLLNELSSTLPLPRCKALDRITSILMYKYRNL